jgi:hypothetical protein
VPDEEGDNTMKAARGKTVSLIFFFLTLIAFIGWGQTTTTSINTVDIAKDKVDFTVFSRDGQDGLGSPNTMALGDFNSDQNIDLLIAAPGGDGPDDRRKDCGEAYIIYGKDKASFVPSLNTDGIPGPDVVIYGRDPGDLLGSGVAAGDVNGDGIDDIILGAPGGDGPTNGYDAVGEVVIIYGGLNIPSRIDLSKSKEDAIIFNGIQRSRFGTAITALDLNGDGIDDIAIADIFSNPLGRNKAGAVFVVYGKRDFPARINIGSRVPGFQDDVRIFGADTNDQIGISLAKGDINHDGLEDLVIGAPFGDGPNNDRPDAGEAYVIYGNFHLPATIDLAATSADITVYGADPQDELGLSVSAGDVNGDKTQDLLIGAPFASGIDKLKGYSGEAYVIYGKPLLPSIIDLHMTSADSRILGAAPLDNLGSSVAAADLNDDGLNDLILGAQGGRGPDNTRARAGNVYVIRSPGDLPALIDLGKDEFNLVIYGAKTGDNLGSALAGGDLGGKGNGFLMMGANGVDSPADGPDAGAIYALFAKELIGGGGPPTPSTCVKGDVDCDGKITIIDARIVCESVLGIRKLTDKEVSLADVAEPFGQITLADAFKIAQVSVGIGTIETKTGASSSQGLEAASALHIQRWGMLSHGSQIEFRALGSGVESVKAEVFTLNGRSIYDSSWTQGNRVLWTWQGVDKPLGNGVYLYVVQALGFDGRLSRSEVLKVILLR